VRRAAERMLADPRARGRIASFHALWLGYQQLPFSPELSGAMRAESDRLTERVVFDGDRDYFDLFRATETFVDRRLATHYGMPAPTLHGGDWVPYGTAPRAGILSHGAVLAAGAKFGDTSPTLRGKFIRERLLCETIPAPPPGVDVDRKPEGAGGSRCKSDRYAEHADVGCAKCHRKLDGVGWGLENFDREGRFREVEAGAPECKIDGEGELDGLGKFHGPAELGALLVESPRFEACVVRQLFRFALGRREQGQDRDLLDQLTGDFRRGGRRFRELLLDLASGPALRYRRVGR
jgi:hypothetical protein